MKIIANASYGLIPSTSNFIIKLYKLPHSLTDTSQHKYASYLFLYYTSRMLNKFLFFASHHSLSTCFSKIFAVRNKICGESSPRVSYLLLSYTITCKVKEKRNKMWQMSKSSGKTLFHINIMLHCTCSIQFYTSRPMRASLACYIIRADNYSQPNEETSRKLN